MAKGYRPSQMRNQTIGDASNKDVETIVDLADVKKNAEDFYEKNKIMLLSVIGGVALLVGGYLAYKFLYQEPKNTEALEQMYQAEIMFEKDSFDLALNNPGGGFAGFKEISENYGGTNAGNLAKYYAGMCNLYLGKFEEAKNYFNDYSASGNIMPILKNGALGDVYAELKDFSQAISYYEKAISANDNDFLTPVYLKKLGLLKNQQGDKAGALAAFKTIQDKYPDSPDGNGIERFTIPLEN